MSKDSRIIRTSFIVLLLAILFPTHLYSQEMGDEMPLTLDLGYLLSQPKYSNIHHDSFCREDNLFEIGNNAESNRPSVFAYQTMTKGTIRVGIKNNCATNFGRSIRNGRCIKYISTGRNDYHVTAIRSLSNADIKVAFLIHDIDEFYYSRLSESKIEVFRFKNGIKKHVYGVSFGGKQLDLSVSEKFYSISVDGVLIKTLRIDEKQKNDLQLCGLFFENTSISMVDDFIVDYPDVFEDIGIDLAVEADQIENPLFGSYCAEKGSYTTSRYYTNKSKRSYRFELDKPSQKQVERNRNNALHSTIMLESKRKGGNKPLDSFVLSMDIFFPQDGEEAWKLDDYFAESIIQVHHAGYNIPFAPSICININRGRIYVNTIWLEAIAKGISPSDNELNDRVENVARITNDVEEAYLKELGFGNCSFLPFLEKGKWHNFTLYVKLGYNENQKPRTVLYINNTKVLDWNTPNAYNCQEYGEFMEFGVYKWSWSSEENRRKTPINKRVIYFDNIYFYI